jgi:hypothetical protein
MTDRPEELDALARDLADALRGTEPLSTVIGAWAIEAFTWRSVDDDLLTAGLLSDSAHDPGPVVTRGERGNRVLVFSTDLRSVELEVLPDRVVGQFSPPSAGTVAVEVVGHEVVATAEVDDLGFFMIEPVPAGVVRLRCSTATTRLVTDWVRL